MGKESSLWLYLKNKINAANVGKDYILTRIETGSTVKGMPDVMFLARYSPVYIELKNIEGKKIDLSVEQVNMIELLVKLGYKVFIVARKIAKDKASVIYVGYGYHARQIAKEGTDFVHLFEYKVGTSDIDEMLKKLQVIA